MSCHIFLVEKFQQILNGILDTMGGFNDKAQNQMMPCQKGIKIVKLCPAFGQSHKYHMVGCIFPVYIYIYIFPLSHYTTNISPYPH